MNLEDLQIAVVDASVGIKLFILEPGSEHADRLFARLVGDPPARFFVPDLFYIECTNILWKYVREFGYPLESARQDVLDLGSLAIHNVPTADLIGDTFELAHEFNLTACDASYAALARRLDAPLVTADAPLAEKLVESRITVHLLAQL
jgi:predicted nucleic acid-binding protein